MSAGGKAAKISVLAPHRNAAIQTAIKMKIPDRDWVFVRDHRMLKGQREMQVIEVWSLRNFDCFERDPGWKEEYQRILTEALTLMEMGRVDTYCRVLFP